MSRSDMFQQASIPVLLLTILLGYGSWSASHALRSSRHMPDSDTTHPALQPGAVHARLWQDPVDAIRSRAHKESDQPRPPPTVSHDCTLTLLVMTSGGGYTEDRERRLRDRWALVSALASCAFAPKDPARIHWFSLHEPVQGPPACPLHERTDIPFEWFERCTAPGGAPCTTPQKIMVCWLNDADFGGQHIVCRVNEVIQCLQRQSRTAGRFAVIGPTYSADLIHTVYALADSPGEQPPWYSPSATIPDSALPGTSRHITRTILTDDVLAKGLVDELRRRRALGSCCASSRRRIVVLSEWDTPYGREMATAFVNAVTADPCSKTDVRTYHVLRGLDGEQPADAESRNAARVKSTPAASPDRLPLLLRERPAEMPAGRAQFDYLRRLVHDIQASDPGGPPISAIGLFSTDVYDKLAILEALRHEFPGVIFFTTDLDARLLMPQHGRWTRNLIVASAFGLCLEGDQRGPVAPFRDCYQTSLYSAVLRACTDAAAVHAVQPPDSSVGPCAAYIYEIGRTRPVLLSGQHADLRPQVSMWSALGLLLAGLLLLIFISYASVLTFAAPSPPPAPTKNLVRRWRNGSDLTRLLLRVLIVSMGGFLIAAAAWAVIHRVPVALGGEPFSWFEGVSTWPTEIIRAAAGVLAIVWSTMLIERWRRTRLDLENEFLLGRAAPPAPPRIGIFGWRPPPLGRNGRVRADALWADYVGLARATHRRLRVWLLTAGYFIFALAMFLAIPVPYRPCRGDWNFTIDIVVVIASTTAAAYLTLLVWDAVLLCHRFILASTSATATQYSHRTLQIVADRYGWSNSYAPSWLDVRIIAALSDSVSRAMYFPVTVLFALVTARTTLFDNWRWDTPVLIVLGVNAVVMLLAGVTLRAGARRARSMELTRLEQERNVLVMRLATRTASAAPPPLQAAIDEIDRLHTDISNVRDGAFAPWREHPVVGAILLPAAGGVAIWLLTSLAAAN